MMRQKPDMEFECVACEATVEFSVQDIETSINKDRIELACSQCGKKYVFDSKLSNQLKMFHELILAVQNAKDIIGNISVGVSINGHSVKIPYRLLLTRMNPTVTLNIGEQEINFKFRVEPLND